MPRPRIVALLLAGGVLAGTCDGLAGEPSTADKAFAEALFQNGRKLMAEGQIAKACAKFGESQRLVPKLGTLLNLARCHELEGKSASAWTEFKEAQASAVRSGQDKRADYAREHAEQVEKQLTRIRIVVREGGMSIRLDGSTVGDAASGTAVPVDPGDHTVEASAPGKKTFKQVVRAQPGPASIEVVIPSLEDAKTESQLGPVATNVSPPRDASRPSPSRGVPAGAIVAFGGAAVGIGVGSVFGVLTFVHKGDAEPHCQGVYCDPDGIDARNNAKTAATISTVTFATGAACAALGVVLVLTAEPSETSPAKTDPTGTARLSLWPPRFDW